jgi:hypothetical protein
MADAREADLTAMIAELVAELPTADPTKRASLEAQIDSLRRALSMGATARSALVRARRPTLSQEAIELFTPDPAVVVPTWLPDLIERDQVTEATVRCPSGARVVTTDLTIGCAIPTDKAPVWHGLSLSFYRSKRLQSQRFYESGLLRWAIEYHPTGGRASVGFFVDREPSTHREQGLHTSYAPGGAVCAQIMWSAGVRHGWTKLWEDDGYPVGATLYDQGRAIEHVLADGTRKSTPR